MQNHQRSFFKSRTWVTVLLIFGIALLIAGLAELLFMPVDASGTTAIPFVTFGFILVFLAGARLFHDENDLLQDERTRKIGAYGLSWSWFLTFIMLFGFFWLDSPWYLQTRCRNTRCYPYPPDGSICQGVPVVPFQER